MKKVFEDFATFVRLHDGMGKPKVNFQDLYKMFPTFEFTASAEFGSYKNFNEAYEQKVYDMIVTTNEGKDVCYMTYREYHDADESTAYVS